MARTSRTEKTNHSRSESDRERNDRRAIDREPIEGSSGTPAPNERTALQRLLATLWQLMVVLALLAAGGVAAWLYALSRADGEICACVKEKLEECFAESGLLVRVESARRLEGRGIEVRGVTLLEHAGRTPLLEIDELFLVCNTDLQELLNKQVAVRHIEVRRPTLRVTRTENGDWDFQRLLRARMPPCTTPAPTVTIDGGRIEIRDARRAESKPLLLTDIHVDIKPDASPSHALAPESAVSPPLTINGSLAGVNFKGGKFTVRSTARMAAGRCGVRSKMSSCPPRSSPRCRRKLRSDFHRSPACKAACNWIGPPSAATPRPTSRFPSMAN